MDKFRTKMLKMEPLLFIPLENFTSSETSKRLCFASLDEKKDFRFLKIINNYYYDVSLVQMYYIPENNRFPGKGMKS